MSIVPKQIDLKSLWKSIGLLVAIAIFANPDAPIPLLILYGILVVVAILFPIRAVSQKTILRLIGSVSLLVGAWVLIFMDLAVVYAVGFGALGIIALLLPRFYTGYSGTE